MAGIDRSRRVTFEEQAEIYDAAVSEYPDEFIDSIIRLANLPPDGRILEIGCGSGQATVSFARRGYTIVAVELGQRLAQMAADKVRPYPLAQVVQHEFESWELPPQRFNLVVSAEAFHWIVPQVGIPKIGQALVPGGMVGLFWRVIGHGDTPLHRAIAAAYAENAPDWPNPLDGEVSVDFIREYVERVFAQEGGFEPFQSHLQTVQTTANGTDCINGLRAFSSHREMPEVVRQKLYAAIQSAFQAHNDCLTQNLTCALFYTHPLKNTLKTV